MGKKKDPDLGWKKFGSGMKKIRIRDKNPGSATTLVMSAGTAVLMYLMMVVAMASRVKLCTDVPDDGRSDGEPGQTLY
jgi:hypothetical protein